MFGRKKPEGETPKRAPDGLEELQLPAKPGARPAPATATVPPRPPVIPPRVPSDPMRPSPEPSRRAEAAPDSDGGGTPAAAPPKREAQLRKLIVGREISLAGEITSCDRLVVEGSVEANLANCRDIEISDTGVYKGSASIEEAEIRGRFDGVLNVRRRLLIRSTGRVAGTGALRHDRGRARRPDLG